MSSTEVADDLAVGLHLFTVEFVSEVDLCLFFALVGAGCLACFALSSAFVFAASSFSLFCSQSAFPFLLLLFPFSSCSSRMAAHLALVRTLAPDIHFAVEALVFGGAGANCTRYLEIYLSSPPGDDSVDPADLR